MPRGRLGARPRRTAVSALRFEQMCHDIRATRRAEHARQQDLKLKQQVSGYAELREQTAVLDIQLEMKAMELRLVNADRLMIGLPAIDVLPMDGSIGDTRRPEDDYRNYR